MIRLEGAGRVYRREGSRTTPAAEVWALHPTDLEIAANEFVVVLGPSGSGKTTLLNLVGGLDTPSSGRVVVAGEAVSHLPRPDLLRYRQRTVGVVFQYHNLLPSLTARENVALAADLVGRQAAVDGALSSVGLDARAHHFPHEMSGGEQQRVAIARCVVKDAPLVLGDEPTGSLDAASGKTVVGLFKDLHAAGRCIVLITHNAVIARVATRVITLRDGRVASDMRNETPQPVDALDW